MAAPPRRFVYVIAGAMAVCLMGLCLLLGLPQSRVGNGVTTTERDGEAVIVELDTTDAPPQVVQTSLRRQGLHVNVEAVPVATEQVGMFVGGRAEHAELRFIDLDQGAARSFLLSGATSAQFDLQYGRSAAKGEPFAHPVSLVGDNREFSCADVLGKTTAELKPALQRVAETISWQRRSRTGMYAVAPEEVGDFYVVQVVLDAPSAATVLVSEAPVSNREPFGTSLCEKEQEIS